ncbi:hypothetical protein [Micromonospora sp. NPDC049301]|uniref:hypothetical protein n=1 Tax=Micromonospora sp. NPDC049301 TaxID=3155723 RepID=UPI00344532FC
MAAKELGHRFPLFVGVCAPRQILRHSSGGLAPLIGGERVIVVAASPRKLG